MNYIITIYRRQRAPSNVTGWVSLPIQHFNASTLPEARTVMIKCQSIRYVWKVELSVILDTWHASQQIH